MTGSDDIGKGLLYPGKYSMYDEVQKYDAEHFDPHLPQNDPPPLDGHTTHILHDEGERIQKQEGLPPAINCIYRINDRSSKKEKLKQKGGSQFHVTVIDVKGSEKK
jgi:hypothetical protein